MNNFFLFLLLLIIFVKLGFLWIFFNKKSFLYFREKKSPFECGFDPKKNARNSFSMRFFVLLIFFLIFDMELVLLMKFPLYFHFFFFSNGVSFMIFFFFLFFSTIEEWRRGALDWSNFEV